MIRWRKNLLATILLAAMGLGCGPQTQRFYVSPAGNDSWSGSMSRQADDKSDGPFATIARARDAVRQLRKAGSTYPIEVVVADGTYFLNEPLTFTADDSGTQTAPVTFGGENHAVLSGGRPINGWHEIEINGKKGWAAELPDVKSGKWNFHQLFVNGQRRPRGEPAQARSLSLHRLIPDPPERQVLRGLRRGQLRSGADPQLAEPRRCRTRCPALLGRTANTHQERGRVGQRRETRYKNPMPSDQRF